ncbi:MAG: hypothetical protein IJJ15_00500 [Ruminococcus sp.]|nr:hypothetical protein [Ruminococcus sp.]
MFRLPVCPHCKTVYHYQDTKKALKKKHCTCYHCEKDFKAGIFPGILVIGCIIVALSILTNMFLLTRMKSLNLIILFVSTFLFLGLLYVLIPFFVSFKKEDEKMNKKTNKKSK